jgi:hypothetical protein
VGRVDESSLNKREQPQNPPARKPYAEADLRASDADRDRIAEILREALAEGRLDAEEHGERIDSVYRAKTVGELEPLVRDLPVGHRADRPAPSAAAERPYTYGPDGEPDETLVAVFSGATRKGRWRVGRRTNAVSVFGGVDLDLTEAVFEHREIRINTISVFGGADIKLPENVSLRCTGTGIFGGFDVDSHESDDPDAPVVVITGFAVFGGTSAKRRTGKRLKAWGRDR